MSRLIQNLVQPGPVGPLRAVARLGLRSLVRMRALAAPRYRSPDEGELVQIERDFAELGMECDDFFVDAVEFRRFAGRFRFPSDYHGGAAGGVYDEKLLEHFVAWKILGLDEPTNGPYIDVAACASPWARLLREEGIEAYAIDLEVASQHAGLDYYRQEDATESSFADASIGGVSLQCAYEMFVGNDDIGLLAELARILRPGGKAVISPLYAHTHACYYQTPEFHGQETGDPGAKAYVRHDCWGIAASRKYSPQTMRSRVWDNALRFGLQPRLKVLRNKREIGDAIYLHFILVLEKRTVTGAVPQESR